MASTDFTIADVLVWARTKPAGESYSYIDSSRCALAQFGEATGRGHLVGLGGSCEIWQRPDLQSALNNGLDYTFGGLVERLEALLPAEPLSDTWTKADAYLSDIEAVELV